MVVESETGNKTDNPRKMGNPIADLLIKLNLNSYTLDVRGELDIKPMVQEGTGRQLAWY